MIKSLQHKRVTCLTALLALTLSVLLPSQLSAQVFTHEGLRYEVLDENARTVMVVGCADAGSKGSGNLILPETVRDNSTGTTYTLVEIGRYAFCNCRGFSGTLMIPNSVTKIGEWAFSDCTGFTGSLSIGNSVITIGYLAFDGCTGFTGTLTIPNSVAEIGDEAFRGCIGFTGLTICNPETKIGEDAFPD